MVSPRTGRVATIFVVGAFVARRENVLEKHWAAVAKYASAASIHFEEAKTLPPAA